MSKVAVQSAPSEWLVTPRPIFAEEAMVIEVDPMLVQVVPSGE